MKNSLFLCEAGLLCLSNVLSANAASTEKSTNSKDTKPNLLIILADDAGYNDFGFMGSKEIVTPNIDALSQSGVTFSDGHVAATVSSPSRACLITGRYGHRFGYECNLDGKNNGLSTDEKTLGDLFSAEGYRTAAIGKWHLGSLPELHPNRRGFDMFYGMLAGGRQYFYDAKRDDRPGDEHNLQLNGVQQKFDGYLTDVFTDKAVEYINESDQPFMMYLAYNAVHTPMQATQEDLDRFKGHPRQKLAAMTYALDRGVGRVVEALKKSGKFDNTVIFFLSDNGGAAINTSSNYPLKGWKGNKFEGGHRVPFFMVWNNHIPAGKKFDGLVSSLDIAATFADAANMKQPKENKLDGVSLIPYLIKDSKKDPHKMLCWRKMDTRAIREGDYKLIITEGVDSVLYNIQEDPEEMNNLIQKEQKIYKRLKKHLSQWEKDVCTEPRWIETGWGDITNGIHKKLMNNTVKEAKDYYKKK